MDLPTFPTLESLERFYRDEPFAHGQVRDSFAASMELNPRLLRHREHVELNALGFGERAFHWLWKLLIDVMPSRFKFLEIGVYKGQVTSLVGMLAMIEGKTIESVALTPLSGFGGKFHRYDDDIDYLDAIRSIEEWSGLPQSSRARIIHGFSDDDRAKQECRTYAPFDLVYIDGCHDYHAVVNDLIVYGEMLKFGGLLVMDDASTELNLPDEIWPGHADVARAVREILEPNPHFAHIGAVGHNRVWRKTVSNQAGLPPLP